MVNSDYFVVDLPWSFFFEGCVVINIVIDTISKLMYNISVNKKAVASNNCLAEPFKTVANVIVKK